MWRVRCLNRSINVLRISGTSLTSYSPTIGVSLCLAKPSTSTRLFSLPASQTLSQEDEKLVNRGDFLGVRGNNKGKQHQRPPETVLNLIQEHMRRNYRVNGEILMSDVLIPLEQGKADLVDVLVRSPDRWVPMIISACGAPLSNVHKLNRMKILQRFLDKFNEIGIPLTITSFNNFLAVMLENEHPFNVEEMMKEAETTRKLELNQESFEHLLEQLAQQGNEEGCRKLVYEMARRGYVVDQKCKESIIYCHAVRGHVKKADSLVEQMDSSHGKEARSKALEACARAAAARGDTDRLRKVLRRSVNDYSKLTFSIDGIFSTLWLLAERSREGDGAEFINLTEQMLDHTMHHAGFFRFLFREIERHICHEHYYTAITLLEETNRVEDCLRNQQKSMYLEQMLGRFCRQLIRTEVPLPKVRDILNRLTAIFRNTPHGSTMYHELLFASLMFKEFTPDQRFEYFSEIVDTVDRNRTRPHLLLPIIVSCDNVEGRLKLIFRSSALGYKDIAALDIRMMVRLILQPLYDKQFSRRRGGESLSRMDLTGKILKSHGVSDDSLWRTVNEWWRLKCFEERGVFSETEQRPSQNELAGWLREQYHKIYAKNVPAKPGIKPTYGRLKTLVEAGDSSKVHAFILSNGWPEETDFEEIVPQVLELYLEHEEWSNVKKMLTILSSQVSRWVKSDGTPYSPVKNYHLIKILRRRANEGEKLSIRKLIDYSYELRRLFPNALPSYESFFEAMHEYRRLFYFCFDKSKPLTVSVVDELIDLVRTIVKLDIISLHHNETLTTVFVTNVLSKLGWTEAVNTWMKFQSGLNCSNGIVALLRYSMTEIPGRADKVDKQYVLHKAQNFMSASRVHSVYTATLMSMNKFEEAEQYVDSHGSEMLPFDGVVAFRLLHALGLKQREETFIYRFLELLLEKTKLKNDEQALKLIQQDWIRMCEQRKLGRLALRIYDLFTSHSVPLLEDEKKRLVNMVEEHEKLTDKWMFAPNGFLKLSKDDPIVTESEVWQIRERLKGEIERERMQRV